MEHSTDIYKSIIEKGETAINDFIENREAETLFLDFKRSSSDGIGKKLHQNDRSNLARSISGFGNSEGGVIVWGVDCREGEDYADVAKAKFPLKDAQKFASWLEGAISSSTIPPHATVRNKAILINDGPSGFVVTYIPKSDHAPHQVISRGKGQNQYFIRAGSDFLPTPHAVLSGMFGRRPQPSVFHMFLEGFPKIVTTTPLKIKTELGLQLANGGQGIASDIFMNVNLISLPGENCDCAAEVPNIQNWDSWSAFGIQFTAISKNGIRLPPQAQIQPFVLSVFLSPPFNNDLEIEGLCGCGQAPSFNFSIKNDGAKIEQYFNEFAKRYSEGTLEVNGEHYRPDFWNLREKSA